MKNSFAILILLLLLNVQAKTEVIESNGEHIFKTICFACHTIGNGKLVGPDLKGVHNRHDESWLLKWVKSAQAVISSGDTSAIKLSKCCYGVTMPDQNLSDDEIKSIFAYIKRESEKDETSTIISSNQPTAQPNNEIPKKTDSSSNGSSNYLWILFFVAAFFLVIIGVLGGAVKTLSDALQNEYKKNKEYEKK